MKTVDEISVDTMPRFVMINCLAPEHIFTLVPAEFP